MITLLLLPYFLVSRVSVDVDSSWLHGPEYTYNAHVSVINVDTHAGDKTKVFNISTALKCRPQVPDTLNCRFDSAWIGLYMLGFVDLGLEPIDGLEMDDEPFEIKFDHTGVDGLIVTKSTRPWMLNMIRTMANQLNIGLDLKNRTFETFTVIEKSFVGECLTGIVLTKKPEDAARKDKMFEIVPFAESLKATGEMMSIEKQRYLDECKPRGSREMFFRNVETKIMSSTSRIIVSDSNFTGFTVNEITISNKNNGKNATLHEEISLKLDTVSPAKSEMQTVPNPVFVSFLEDLKNEERSYQTGR